MASSPTAYSRSSSFSAAATADKFGHLPVMALRDKIVEKIMENRVTLIIGETGCGKSSQIPQFLLEQNMEPILCTQPRRFAVIAVARMVAKARNCEIGGEVGYHIGHSKVVSARTKIFFKTAGVLLDEMREKGLNALNYKVIILDEVHERSVESDLVLVCMKQYLLKNNNLRLVLMSATADHTRYKEYFKNLGRDQRVEVIAIPSTGQQTVFQRRVLYLEEVADLLEISSGTPEALSKQYCSGISPAVGEADIKPEVHRLIHDLVIHIHNNEPDIEKSILIFLPTYNSLEQQWFLLGPCLAFKVFILHSSIDTEQALMAMKIWKSHRKVILATNIAESSVTIPKVAYVIDSCRSLQVYWDGNRKKDCPELVWVSKSQAEQRRGRTGRTCDGQVFRLMTGSFFSQLQDYECPAILKLSLRLQVLMLCCAESKAINEPRGLLRKALDAPDPQVVEDALSLLLHARALERTSVRGRYEPTFYGRLIVSFSLSFDASVLILKFGDAGMLREGILLGILMDTQPLPILRPFGQELLFTEYTENYFGGDSGGVLTGKKERGFMANLSAVQFWQRVFKDKHRIEHLNQLFALNEGETTQEQLLEIEEEWCSFHNLVRSSLCHIIDIYEDVLYSIHRFRPKFLFKSDGLPSYYDPYEFEHTCLLKSEPSGNTDSVDTDDKKLVPISETMKCITVPFVASGDFHNNDVAEKMGKIIKEIRIQLTEETADNQNTSIIDNGFQSPSLCKFYPKGLCNQGSQCRFSHSLQAKAPVCKFFLSLGGCRYGDSCNYSHDLGQSGAIFSEPSLCLPEDGAADAASLIRLLPNSSDACILILDDADLHFSSYLSRYCNPSKIISTTPLSDTAIIDPSLTSIRVMWGLHHPYDTIISRGENPIPWNEVKCVLWFPVLDGFGEQLEEQGHLMKKFFEYLAIRMLGDALYDVPVIVTMNNLRFSELQVEKLGRECFFFLTESFPYDESNLGELSDKLATKKPMVVSRAISYVFDLHPPTDIQFGDYTSVLHKCLYNSREGMRQGFHHAS